LINKRPLTIRFSLTILVVFLSTLLFSARSFGNSPHLRRICISSAGVVTLSWYSYTDTCQRFEKILIFGEQHFGSFKLVDSTKNPNATNVVLPNAAKYLGGYFFIEYISNCSPNRISISDTLQVDSTPPQVTNPDSVSVLPDGKVVIGWSTSPTSAYKDTKGFIINVVKAGSFPLDTIYRNKGNNGIDTSANANNHAYSYQLAGIDSCDNVSALGGVQTTAFLQSSQDSCKYTVTLSWSGYAGWRFGVRYYYVYYSTDPSKGYTYAGQEDGTSFTFKGLSNLTKYYFFVRAVENSNIIITASSNVVSLVTRFQKPFKFVYIKTVTTVGKSIEIDWTTDNNPEAGYFEIYRGINIESLHHIATVSGTTIAGGEYNYVDNAVDATTQVRYYMVKAFNTCGQFGGQSNVPHNILLKLSKSGRIKILSWNPYETWSGGVLGYSVYRTVEDANPASTDIANLNKSTLDYVDLDSFSDYARPGICYQVKGIEDGDSDAYGFAEVSYSNTICYVDTPVVYVPNAFTPSEVFNTVFKPVVSYTDTLQSQLEIFNRWGELVFKTNAIKAGWDGTMKNGEIAPSGVYVYYLTVIGLDFKVRRYKGTVSLL